MFNALLNKLCPVCVCVCARVRACTSPHVSVRVSLRVSYVTLEELDDCHMESSALHEAGTFFHTLRV